MRVHPSLLALLVWAMADGAKAEVLTEGCAPIESAVFATPGAVPDELLADSGEATRCLVDVLLQLAPRVTGPQIAAPDSDALSRATAALGKLIARDGIPAIDEIRRLDTLSAASLMSFGARSEDPNTRRNTTILLSNIVDNSTVCVVMDHLADPLITDEGRANLLAVASVVAPWAMKSNYSNMQRLIGYSSQAISEKKSVEQAAKILENFKARLQFQDKVEQPNRNTDSLAARECWNWTPLFENPGFTIKYPSPVAP